MRANEVHATADHPQRNVALMSRNRGTRHERAVEVRLPASEKQTASTKASVSIPWTQGARRNSHHQLRHAITIITAAPGEIRRTA
jgi:hypothetical protein